MPFDRRGIFTGSPKQPPSTIVNGSPRPGGYIFKFTPDRRGHVSEGQLYALKIVRDTGGRTGQGIWLPLDREAVQVDADAEPQSVRLAKRTVRDAARLRRRLGDAIQTSRPGGVIVSSVMNRFPALVESRAGSTST